MNLEINPAALDSPEAVALDAELQQEYLIRYGGPDTTPVAPQEFTSPGGVFLVAWLDGEAVGCGGFRTVGDGVAEVKKMYVSPAARGRGVAKGLLAALEERAAASGCGQVVLETGSVQPEAFALYTSHGYRATPPFGIYRDSPAARHLGKSLLPAGPSVPRMRA
ncbi:MAG: GNAT family N-acetyltransferase [Pseudonocardiales bacterium]